MRREPSYRIAVFHRDELNRKGLITLLSSEFVCEEIERWEDVSKSNTDTLIILQPELLSPKISLDSVKEDLERLKANVVLVNCGEKMWWIFNPNIRQLRSPSVERIMNEIRKLHPINKSRRRIFKIWIRA